ncbi:MAG: hypothetical protein IIC66_13535 [candidate division Zixibacteria bacterium]|nr:hypothetical protein [candidate division Zixibacteria bacterium]
MGYKGKREEAKPLILPNLNVERNSEDAFMTDLVAASNELRSSLLLSAKLLPRLKIEPNHMGILIGLMVRLYKLYDTYLYLICDHRLEIALLLGRSVCETAIDLAYLCKNLKAEEFNKFIKVSLATSKKIYDEIENDKSTNSGNRFIQQRIQTSILEDFDEARFKLEEVNYSDLKGFGTIAVRARGCNMEREYLFVFKNLSRLTHASWSEFVKYHLAKSRNLWYANHNYSIPRPQSLDGIAILVTEATENYVNTVVHGFELSDRLKKIREWFLAIAIKHEQFMSMQQ